MLWDGGSGYKTYVFKESIRRYAIDRKGRGRKEVIYLRVADVSYTRGVRESTGLLLWRPLRCGSVILPPLL
jgi:hypothetical protein